MVGSFGTLLLITQLNSEVLLKNKSGAIMVKQSPIHDQINLHQFKRFVTTDSIKNLLYKFLPSHTYHWFTHTSSYSNCYSKVSIILQNLPNYLLDESLTIKSISTYSNSYLSLSLFPEMKKKNRFKSSCLQVWFNTAPLLSVHLCY